MANPVNNAGANTNVNLGGAPKLGVRVGVTARVSQNHGQDAMQSVSHNFTKNPNNAPPTATAQNALESPNARANGRNNVTSPPARENVGENGKSPNRAAQMQKQSPHVGEDGDLANQPARGENGAANASEQGLRNGRGHHKNEVNTGETPPIIVLPNGDGDEGKQTGRTQTTPPIIVFPNDHDNGNHHGKQNFPPILTPRNPDFPNQQPNRFPPMGTNYSIELNLRAHGNQPYGLIRQVVSQILRQTDVYLSHNALNRLINQQTLQTNSQTNSRTNLPPDVQQFVQNVSRQVLNLLSAAPQNGKLIHDISKQISRELRENVQTARQTILKSSELGAVHFKNLNPREKLYAAIELLPPHLPAKALEQLQNHRPQEVLNGLLLARGFVAANEQPADVRNLVALKSNVLPAEISITALRDVGQLVKVLIVDTTAARTTANLDLAVQKFVKILFANNEIGVLLATVNLASTAQNQGGLVSRSLALAQIYELITRLVEAGEKALQNAAPEKKIANQDRNIFQTVGAALVDESDDAQNLLNKLHAHEAAASSLRQFLEFNPALMQDRSASAFTNHDDARQAQKDFVDYYYNDIEDWLKSGNHRFVKDYDFDKPVGIVVERGSDDVFSATTARFVLVRDGSVQGWHFLKSFLVK